MSQTKSAIITGGATGIGLAIAQTLNRSGFTLTLVGRRADKLREAAESLPDQTLRIDVVSADVGDAAVAADIVGNHVSSHGSIDGLVTAAAVYDTTPLLDLTPDAWNATTDVALRGSVFFAVEAAKRMKAQGSGRIVLFSSINGFYAEPESVQYSAAKAAINSVVRSFAVELAGTGVVTNAIAPGWVRTPMTEEYIEVTSPETMRRVNPLGRPGRPEEIAEVARYLLVDAPEFLLGTTLYVDGGQTAQAPMA